MDISIDIDNNVEDPVEEQPDELEFDDAPFKVASGTSTEIIQPPPVEFRSQSEIVTNKDQTDYSNKSVAEASQKEKDQDIQDLLDDPEDDDLDFDDEK